MRKNLPSKLKRRATVANMCPRIRIWSRCGHPRSRNGVSFLDGGILMGAAPPEPARKPAAAGL